MGTGRKKIVLLVEEYTYTFLFKRKYSFIQTIMIHDYVKEQAKVA